MQREGKGTRETSKEETKCQGRKSCCDSVQRPHDCHSLPSSLSKCISSLGIFEENLLMSSNFWENIAHCTLEKMIVKYLYFVLMIFFHSKISHELDVVDVHHVSFPNKWMTVGIIYCK